MYTKVILLLALTIISGFVVYIYVQPSTESIDVLTDLPTSTGDGPTGANIYVESVNVNKRDGSLLSIPISLNASNAEELREGFFTVGTNIPVTRDEYSIYYNTETASMFILLFSEPLGEARKNAESQIKAITNLSDSELCALAISVRTNEYVNPTLMTQELGLSFCPGSFPLD